MNSLEIPTSKFPNVEEIIKKLSAFSGKLEQDTKDTAQLNPMERMNSIIKVWDSCKDKIGKPALALDAGSGFGYGTVFLESQGIKTIGIENVSKKIKQGQDMLKNLGINVPSVNNLDFSKHPAFYEGDLNNISDNVQVDLITAFYLSLVMFSQAETFKTLERLLKKDGTILLSTEASAGEAEAFFENKKEIPFSYEIIEIPDNFEKTVILLKHK